MSGVTLSLTTQGLDAAIGKLQALAGFEMAELVDGASAILESSTKQRLDSEKSAPDGSPWSAWSEDYAASRGSQHSLLVGENDLLESVQSYGRGDVAIVGTNLVYGAVHQLGSADTSVNIPARPFLGLSAQDAQDIEHLVTGTLEGLMQ